MFASDEYEVDEIQTSAGELKITFLGHGSLMFTFNDEIIHIDPFNDVADYSSLPEADLILITHEHRDHLDHAALESIRTENTEVVLTVTCAQEIRDGIVMKNGDVTTIRSVRIEAVPAYNLVHKRESGEPFHPEGIGNGYVLNFGDKRVYIAGDTENIRELEELQSIDIAFLPMNLPYTMTPEMVADASKTINPKILYPYHYGSTDTSRIKELLADREDIEVRIRQMA
jgi:L-ascorbate metabolism protein UlaG (beta-lactamase superfamily)